MRSADFLLPALRQFRTQRLQALLIAVAIALGVSVIIAVMAQVQAARQSAQSLTASLMAREIHIRSTDQQRMLLVAGEGPAAVRQVGFAADEPVVFSLEDLEAARSEVPGADHVYFTQFHGMFREDGANRGFVDARAVTADYFAAAGFKLLQGSFFTSRDYETAGRVLLVSQEFLQELELPGDAVGSMVELDGGQWEITGVIALPEPRFNTGSHAAAYVPLGAETLNRSNNPEFAFAVDEADRLDLVQEEVEAFATARWGRRIAVERSFAAGAAGSDTVMLLIAAFASLGLLVAALNIMNLMLARVLRRERETGINRSLGATRTTVAGQVLAEALALGLLGGLLGIAAGQGLLQAYNAYLKAASGGLEPALFTVTLPWSAALLGVALAMFISLLFGLYPALAASRVQPVAALRRL
jgi:putative ABC transport system permease protein